MSWRATSAAKGLRQGLTRSEKLLLLILADYHDDETDIAWPSFDTLAADSLMSRRTVIYVLQQLEHKGFLAVHKRRRQDGRQDSNAYELLFLKAQSANFAPWPIQSAISAPPECKNGPVQSAIAVAPEPSGAAIIEPPSDVSVVALQDHVASPRDRQPREAPPRSDVHRQSDADTPHLKDQKTKTAPSSSSTPDGHEPDLELPAAAGPNGTPVHAEQIGRDAKSGPNGLPASSNGADNHDPGRLLATLAAGFLGDDVEDRVSYWSERIPPGEEMRRTLAHLFEWLAVRGCREWRVVDIALEAAEAAGWSPDWHRQGIARAANLAQIRLPQDNGELSVVELP